MYLYRAVDSTGQTLDFRLNVTRSTRAAKRFFRKVLGRPNVTAPRVINVDKNPAYIGAVNDLNDEMMHMIRKGQIEGIEKGNVQGQNRFIAELFGLTV